MYLVIYVHSIYYADVIQCTHVFKVNLTPAHLKMF